MSRPDASPWLVFDELTLNDPADLRTPRSIRVEGVPVYRVPQSLPSEEALSPIPVGTTPARTDPAWMALLRRIIADDSPRYPFGPLGLPRDLRRTPARWLPQGVREPWWSDLGVIATEQYLGHVETLIGLRPKTVSYFGVTFNLGHAPDDLRRAAVLAKELSEGYALLHDGTSYPARWWREVAETLSRALRVEATVQELR